MTESCPIQQSQVVVPVIPKDEWAKYGGTGLYRTITFPEQWGYWAPWSSWTGPCCGRGEQNKIRSRVCDDPWERYCKGETSQTAPCDIGFNKEFADWNEWPPWEECSVTCGLGMKSRTRSCHYTRTSCISSGKCQFQESVKSDCSINDEIPGEWGSWDSWSICSASCGTAVTFRHGVCNAAVKQGSLCPPVCQGSGTQYENCSLIKPEGACPDGEVVTECHCTVSKNSSGLEPYKICAKDDDYDGWPDEDIPCPEQGYDTDNRCIQDNCEKANPGQGDVDNDGLADLVCDKDSDNDGVPDTFDLCVLDSRSSTFEDDEDDHDDFAFHCDTCPYVWDPTNQDVDLDGEGDVCDDDADNDGIENDNDNCEIVINVDQTNKDNDVLGDACDNCPEVPNNPIKDEFDKDKQPDDDFDSVGNPCDLCPDYNSTEDKYVGCQHDEDRDGIQDDIDNCASQPNSDQSDIDKDGSGDVCDSDIDDDSLNNSQDNCPYVSNPDQADCNPKDNRGDACQSDEDGDGISDLEDPCPRNSGCKKISFILPNYFPIAIYIESGNLVSWGVVGKDARTLHQGNTGLMAAVSMALYAPVGFGGVDFEATTLVDSNDQNYMGLFFAHQNKGAYYGVLWKKSSNQNTFGKAEKGFYIKRIHTTISNGLAHARALWRTEDYDENKATMLYANYSVGWEKDISYRWKVQHRPQQNAIRVVIKHSGSDIVLDTGVIYDTSSHLMGGRLGAVILNQEGWFANIKFQGKFDDI